MKSNGANGSSDIADILAAIQKMAAEKKPRPKMAAGKDAISSKTDETTASKIGKATPANQNLAELPLVLRSRCEDKTVADNRPDPLRTEHTVHNPADIPRKIGNLRCNHITKMSEMAAKAWPGLASLSEQDGTIMRCFGSVINSVQAKQPAVLPGSAQATGCSVRDRLPELPLIPGNMVKGPVPEPNAPGVLPGLPLIQQSGGGAVGSGMRRLFVPEPSHPVSLPGLPEVPRPNPADAAEHGNPHPRGGAIRESTAQLLRPLIMRWVNENMPAMVERALLVEEAVAGKR